MREQADMGFEHIGTSIKYPLLVTSSITAKAVHSKSKQIYEESKTNL